MLNHPDESHDTLSEYRAGRPDDEEAEIPADVAGMVAWSECPDDEYPTPPDGYEQCRYCGAYFSDEDGIDCVCNQPEP